MSTAAKFDRTLQRLLPFLDNRISIATTKYPNLTNLNYWGSISLLKNYRQEAIEAATSLIESRKIHERFLAITLLGEICNPVEEGEEAQADMIASVLSGRAKKETNVVLLEATADALGKIYRISTMPAIYDLSFHQNDNVRLSATQAYSSGLDVDGDNFEPKYLDRIICLSEDRKPEIRSWATFTIGQQFPFSEMSDSKITEALINRTHDRHSFTRTEAFLGLAERGETDQIESFMKWLDVRLKRNWSGDLIKNVRAAGYFSDPKLHSYILRARKLSKDIGAENEEEEFGWALKRCDPDPVVRAMTPISISLNLGDFPWKLDKSGSRIIYPGQGEVVDLKNNCELIDIVSNHHALVLIFKKVQGDGDWVYLQAGEKINLVITGLEPQEVPEVRLPAKFQGVKDIEANSCTLVINNEEYRIKAGLLLLQVWPAH